jgi:hypothetical protein
MKKRKTLKEEETDDEAERTSTRTTRTTTSTVTEMMKARAQWQRKVALFLVSYRTN